MKATEQELKEIFKWVGERITTKGIDKEAVNWLFDEFEQALPSSWEIASEPKQPRAKKKVLGLFGVVPSFLILLGMALIQAIVTIIVRDWQSYIAFPIAYFVGWAMCIIWNKIYPQN
jgi:hypothetical protein